MGRYLNLWEFDMSRMPVDPKGQFELHAKLIGMLKEDMKNGITKDFGMFLGGNSGFAIDEGTEEEVFMVVAKYSPYIKSTIHPILSTKQLEDVMETFKKNM